MCKYAHVILNIILQYNRGFGAEEFDCMDDKNEQKFFVVRYSSDNSFYRWKYPTVKRKQSQLDYL